MVYLLVLLNPVQITNSELLQHAVYCSKSLAMIAKAQIHKTLYEQTALRFRDGMICSWVGVQLQILDSIPDAAAILPVGRLIFTPVALNFNELR